MKPSPNTSPNVLLALILVPIFMIAAAGHLNGSEKRTLDGNAYAIIMNSKDDILTFRDGSFQSNLYAERGYDKGDYTTVKKDSGIWFEARTVSPDLGELSWTGVVTGDAIKGSYLYTKKGWFLFGDTTKQKNFYGSLKAK